MNNNYNDVPSNARINTEKASHNEIILLMMVIFDLTLKKVEVYNCRSIEVPTEEYIFQTF